MSEKESKSAQNNLPNSISHHNIRNSIIENRPANKTLWYSQFIRNYKIPETDYFYTYHFPALRISKSTSIIRIHDPFLKSANIFHEMFTKSSYKNKIARIVRSIAFECVKKKAIIVCNTFFTAYKISSQCNIPLDRLHVIPNSFEYKSHDQLKLLKYVNDSLGNYFLMVCGLRGNKRPDIVINTWSSYSKTLPKMVAVGNIPVSCLNKNSLDALYSGRLILMNRVSESELTSLSVNSNAMIFASEYEGFGRPVIEALISGVPSIANDLEVFKEIDTGDVDFFSLKNPNSLVPIMEKYSSKIDEERSKVILDNVKMYSHENVGKKWKALLEQC
jgi:glycosyltransferase involved in cell wall biosynthesis